MDFYYSEKVQELSAELEEFMAEHVYPNEKHLRGATRGLRGPLEHTPDHGGAQGRRRAPPGSGTSSCPTPSSGRG